MVGARRVVAGELSSLLRRRTARALRSLLLVVLLGAGCADGDARTSSRATPPETAAPAVEAPVGASGVRLALGTPEAPERVGPPEGHPLSRIDRDAGISARLGDGSTVWFFGDTGERLSDGRLRFFEIGSAAWAPPGAPTITRDHVVDGQVEHFATPTPEFPACPPEAPSAGMWPTAAVTDPQDPDRVIVWMANICLGSNRTAVPRGISVGEWRHDPTAPPVDRPIKVKVLEQNLFPDGMVGEAAFTLDGTVYLYGCDTAISMEDADDPGSCRAARVDPASVHDRGAHEAWTGDAWVRGAAPAELEMEPAAGGQSLPPGPLSVAGAPDGDGFVMLYSPWPGHVSSMEVRAALSPEGPWSPPVRVDLPGCNDHPGGQLYACYAANVQPDLSTPGRLGFGYYDRFISGPPLWGSYVVSSIDLRLEPVEGR